MWSTWWLLFFLAYCWCCHFHWAFNRTINSFQSLSLNLSLKKVLFMFSDRIWNRIYRYTNYQVREDDIGMCEMRTWETGWEKEATCLCRSSWEFYFPTVYVNFERPIYYNNLRKLSFMGCLNWYKHSISWGDPLRDNPCLWLYKLVWLYKFFGKSIWNWASRCRR